MPNPILTLGIISAVMAGAHPESECGVSDLRRRCRATNPLSSPPISTQRTPESQAPQTACRCSRRRHRRLPSWPRRKRLDRENYGVV